MKWITRSILQFFRKQAFLVCSIAEVYTGKSSWRSWYTSIGETPMTHAFFMTEKQLINSLPYFKMTFGVFSFLSGFFSFRWTWRQFFKLLYDLDMTCIWLFIWIESPSSPKKFKIQMWPTKYKYCFKMKNKIF